MKSRLQLVLNKGPLGYASAESVAAYIESNTECTIEINALDEFDNGKVYIDIFPFYEEDSLEFNTFVAGFMAWLYS